MTDITYMTKKELKTKLNEHLKKVTLKDQKWLYCYFNSMDEWPLITDEVKDVSVSKDHIPVS